MLINYSLIENNFAPVFIQVGEKAGYYRILAEHDVEGFVTYVGPLIDKEHWRISAFKNKEDVQINDKMSKRRIFKNDRKKTSNNGRRCNTCET